MSHRRPSQSLWWWIVVFVSVVIIIHSLIQLGLLLFWHARGPFSAWDLLLAIIGSEIVAILAGAVTVVVSWRMTQHFGEESTESITSQVRQAMSTTLSEKGAFLLSVAEMVEEALRDPNSLFLASFSTADLPGGKDCGDALGRLIAADRRAAVAVPSPAWLADAEAGGPAGDEREFWEGISKPARDGKFSASFAKRRSLLIPMQGEVVLSAACLLREDTVGRFRVVTAAAGNDGRGGRGDFIGAVTKIDEQWGNAVLQGLCANLQEPKSTYARSTVAHDDILRGTYTGLQTTRSIITTQFLLACESVLHISPTIGGMRTLPVSLPDGRTGQFEYSPEQFFPPAFISGDHSGSLLGQLIWNGLVEVKDRTVLEIGCGPGYVTTIMSKKCGRGGVVALDISARALAIAEENVKRNGNRAVVTFVCGDANDLVFNPNAGAGGVNVTTKGGVAVADGVNMILIDLPLLPYRGKRALSVMELPYLEPIDAARGGILPPSIVRVLGSLATPIRDAKGEIILPVCAASETELEQVKEEVGQVVGGCVVERVSPATDGFVHCLRVRCK
jgi:SAM-dependent methyltransferase